jgi:predicted permease
MAPAWQATRANPLGALARDRREPVGAVRSRIAFTLVSVQIALSLMLIFAAGLFTRTFAGLTLRDLGFASDRVLIVNLNARGTPYKPAQLVSLYDRVLGAASNVPGVKRAALSDITPVSGSSRMAVVEVAGGPPLAPADQMTHVNVISPGWLATYGIHLIAGRDFTPDDRLNAPPVALVNEAFARRFLGRTNVIGRHVAVGAPGAMSPVQIVGLVRDAVYESPRESPPPTLFTSTAQRAAARPAVNVSILAAGDAALSLSRSVAAAISEVDRGLVLRIRTLEQQVDDAMSQERLIALLSGFFGALALLLAVVGLYGVTAYAVSGRRGEIAVRLALGAERASVIHLILRRVTVALGMGIVVGTFASLWASRFLGALLWGIDARDPATFATAAVVLLSLGAFAGWLPAWRASRMDPAPVLRE